MLSKYAILLILDSQMPSSSTEKTAYSEYDNFTI